RADGAAIAGRGVVARVLAAEVEARLAAAVVDDPVDRPGTGAVALGALPFRPGAPGSLVVPEVVLGHDGAGGWWVTTIGTDEAPPPDPATVDLRPAAEPTGAGPGRFDVRSARPPADWCSS